MPQAATRPESDDPAMGDPPEPDEAVEVAGRLRKGSKHQNLEIFLGQSFGLLPGAPTPASPTPPSDTVMHEPWGAEMHRVMNIDS